MSFTGKANAGMAKFAKSMKDGMENCKVDGKISEQQKRIKKLKKEIGNLALLRLEAGDEMSSEIMERYWVIQEAKEVIAELEKEKKITEIVCPKCGAKTLVDMKYCGKCGVELAEA